MEGDSPYAILRYICHRGVFYVRQMGSDILDSEYHPEKERQGSGGEGRRGGYRRSGEVIVALD